MQPFDLYTFFKKTLKQFPRGHLMALGAVLLSLPLLLALTPSGEPVRHSTPLTLSLIDAALPDDAQLEEVASDWSPEWNSQQVKRGDNLSLIFKRVGLSDRDLYELVSSNKAYARELKRIMPGDELKFDIDPQGQLQALLYVEDDLNSRLYKRTDIGFSAEKLSRTPDVQLAYREGRIESSLFEAAQFAGLNDNLTMELANIFGWDIDFALEVRKGDHFNLLYEEKFLDGKWIGNGRILAAEFTNRNTTFKAVYYEDKKGLSHYYTPDGHSMRKEFLRTPIELARISSHFNLRRKHPVLNRIRAHKGTDYAAARGTPIRTTGDGKVIHVGRKGGYGKTVIIQHGQGYKTLYAHMNGYKRGIRRGTRVKQGQVIGFVGATGLATGPHLHYEFYVNGAVRNPVTVKLPQARAIAKSELDRFKREVAPIVTQLASFQRTTQLARADATDGEG